jgi:hypothetical protein
LWIDPQTYIILRIGFAVRAGAEDFPVLNIDDIFITISTGFKAEISAEPFV